MVLETVVAQQLIPGISGELLPVFEILHMNSAARNLIREGKTHQLQNLIASAGAEGMISMDQSILALYKAGKISREVALSYADNAEQLSRRLN
jgi:twitching motility protein PilT